MRYLGLKYLSLSQIQVIILKDESVECTVCVLLPLQSHQLDIMKTKKVIIL